MVAFYHEPRLLAVTSVLAASFLSNAAGVQHTALLQRQMRFTAIAVIEILALGVSAAVGVGMALYGYGYWSLVAALAVSRIHTAWITTADLGMPRRGAGVSHDAIWNYDHLKRPCRVCCLQPSSVARPLRGAE
jgi:PST family polysaccharide transporter